MTTFSTAKKRNKKQLGALSIDGMIYTSAIIISVLFVMSKGPALWYKINTARFSAQASEIVQATQGRANLATLTIAKLCARDALDKGICGTANDGRGTNPFGGDWILSGNASSSALIDLTATLPNDQNRVLDLADLMAPTTRSGCTEATGCSTIKTTADSVVMTY
ncbi:hypothetical protein VF_B0031 (plasmid) [Aliivibrio fischeri ES114]|uniref:Uncharacterized protein n=1 Tax=Aliivibrio fischeri (strain ATCC 700601 / ES114) TaxID=312309 RepID=Q5DY73_ALIF1|nr:hypothetical protein [Aliivibrio fischeri]AAW88273.1 hypothetical protein VF_B0031 [Aliivibrio fischeri ES114]KLU77248.1 hypothetical protein AB192_18820 [Aliivibrio fischeri]MUK41499.1 hypothetical protein [Aliivibrio fischeri]